MRILILIPENYTLLYTIKHSFEKMAHEVINLNYFSFFKSWQNKLITKTDAKTKPPNRNKNIEDGL